MSRSAGGCQRVAAGVAAWQAPLERPGERRVRPGASGRIHQSPGIIDSGHGAAGAHRCCHGIRGQSVVWVLARMRPDRAAPTHGERRCAAMQRRCWSDGGLSVASVQPSGPAQSAPCRATRRSERRVLPETTRRSAAGGRSLPRRCRPARQDALSGPSSQPEPPGRGGGGGRRSPRRPVRAPRSSDRDGQCVSRPSGR